MIDTIWIHNIKNNGATITIKGRMSKNIMNDDGRDICLKQFIIMDENSYNEFKRNSEAWIAYNKGD